MMVFFYLQSSNFTDSGMQAAYVAVMQRVSPSSRLGFDSLLRVYRETDLSQEKTRILSTDKSLVKIFVEYKNLLEFLLIICPFLPCTGSIASCPDPNIVLEVLNFVLTSEVEENFVYPLLLKLTFILREKVH